jgi:transketolase
MRSLPNMTVVVPADASAAEALVSAALLHPGPLYVRLGRKPAPALPVAVSPPPIGAIQRLREGRDVLIAACGPHPVVAALTAADALAAGGVSAGVLNVQTLKPLDVQALLDAAAGAALVVTVEEHYRTGGLGSLVAETLSEAAPTRVLRVGMPDRFAAVAGGHDFLLDHYGISAEAIVPRVREVLGLDPPPESPADLTTKEIPWL